jgi:hypothetical protein
MAVAHLAHLVDGIAELEAAVLNVDRGLGIGEVAAVDVDDAGHESLGERQAASDL